MPLDLTIRSAKAEDSGSLARLAGQLGYPCKEDDVGIRVGSYINSRKCRIIVAELGAELVGWTSLDVIDHFYLEPYVDISGFIVDERYRNLGIGKELVKEAVRWTRENGYSVLRLKTNITRKDAHRFYESNGFIKTKEQFVYARNVGQGMA